MTAKFKPEKEAMEMTLGKRKKMKNETMNEYIGEIQNLCLRINEKMSEEEIGKKAMKGLDTEMIDKLAPLDNTTLEKLQKNIT